MRDTVPDAVIRESHRAYTRVTSWRDGEPLADIPLDSGELQLTAGANIPGRLDITAPGDYAPRDYTDPLAMYGQRLALESVIVDPAGREYRTPLGWYLIQGWDHDPPGVDVEALSLEQIVADYRLTTPYQAPAGATFASTLRSLLAAFGPVDTSALTDRALPSGFGEDWVEDRLAALRALATSWPAHIRFDDDGVAVAEPPRTVADVPDVEWVHGERSAYVTVGGSGLRDELYNAVVARGQKDDGTPIQAMARDTDPASPTYYLGPFGRRPRFYESPLITTRDQAVSAAATVLARELRRSAVVVVTAPPDPRVELFDTAAVTLDDGRRYRGQIVELTLPLTAAEGPATYTVGIAGAGSW